MLPEYACEPWLWFAPRPLSRPAELEWLAARAAEALPRLAELPGRHDVALLAGAMPVSTGTAYRNRAHLLLPDGRVVVQDKLCLLPLERNPQGYWLEPGSVVRIVTWRGLRIAIAVCLDVELPALAVLLADRELDLLLVPSMTERAAGYARVAGCAKARAIELMTTVCVAGCLGTSGSSQRAAQRRRGCGLRAMRDRARLGRDRGGGRAGGERRGAGAAVDRPRPAGRTDPGAAPGWRRGLAGGWSGGHLAIEELG